MRVLVIGELNVDLILQGFGAFPELGKEVLVQDSFLTLGSSSAICAVGLARLGEDVAFVGKVGRDLWGEFCLAKLAEEGIDTSRVMVDERVKTGITTSITGGLERALVTHPGSIVELRAQEIGREVFEGFDHLHMASYFMQTGLRPGCAALMETAERAGLTTSLDPGYDPDERWERDLADTLHHVDVFLPNERELRGVSGEADLEAGMRKVGNGRTTVVVKRGCEGAAAWKEGRLVTVPAVPVTPVDTTGAGDSFNAGFLHRWLAGAGLEEALRYGAACGALSTRALGGTGAQPREAEVERLFGRAAAG